MVHNALTISTLEDRKDISIGYPNKILFSIILIFIYVELLSIEHGNKKSHIKFDKFLYHSMT